MAKTALQEIVSGLNSLEHDFESMRADQEAGKKITPAARQTWLDQFDELFQREMPDELERRFTDLHAVFLRHFAQEPKSSIKPEPVSEK